MLTLGIETSCDDTGVAILKADNDHLQTLANIISSQISLHAEWGGVVPNLAAREHLKNALPVLEQAFKKSEIKPSDIDLITVTSGPGLIPALLVGTNFAKTLSYLWQKPLLGIHHIEGHIYSNFIAKQDERFVSPKFPLLALIVSGGHTQLILMNKHLQYKIIGETQDDAVGEAFDKVARILDLGYPGGPVISAEAEKFKKTNELPSIDLPRPMISSSNFDFSFSGLKTAVLYKVKDLKQKLSPEQFKEIIPEICYEFQQACIDVLVKKTIRAGKKHNVKTITLAGGVSANRELREQLGENIKKEFENTVYLIPEMQYTADNAAMIATAGYFRWQNMSDEERKNCLKNWQTLQADAQLKIGL